MDWYIGSLFRVDEPAPVIQQICSNLLEFARIFKAQLKISACVSTYYNAHFWFESKLRKSKLSKIEQIEQKRVFVSGENEGTEMGKRLVCCKAVNPKKAAYPDADAAE